MLKKIVSLILAAATVMSVACIGFADSEEVTGFTAEDFLTTKGQSIVNQKGEKVLIDTTEAIVKIK